MSDEIAALKARVAELERTVGIRRDAEVAEEPVADAAPAAPEAGDGADTQAGGAGEG